MFLKFGILVISLPPRKVDFSPINFSNVLYLCSHRLLVSIDRVPRLHNPIPRKHTNAFDWRGDRSTHSKTHRSGIIGRGEQVCMIGFFSRNGQILSISSSIIRTRAKSIVVFDSWEALEPLNLNSRTVIFLCG